MSENLNSKNLKIIFYAPILSYPPKGGPELSVVNAIKSLNKNCELHIITNIAKSNFSEEALNFFNVHSFKISFCPRSISVGAAPILERIFRFVKRDIFPSLFPSLEARFIKKYALREGVKIFWIDRVIEHAFPVFKKIRSDFPRGVLIGDTEAVHSRFILRELPLIKNPVRWIKVFYKGMIKRYEEHILVKRANVVTAVSEVDELYYQSLTSIKSKIMRFSNTVDFSEFEESKSPSVTIETPNVLLLGTFGHKHSPMDMAADWLRNSVMPLVWDVIPNLHLYIVGLNADITQANIKNDRVIVIGNPRSVLPYLKNTIATLVPLQFESGTRFKIVESGAAAVACISTTLGAEGLRVTDKKDILIADDEFSFSEAIIKVVLNPDFARKLGGELRILVKADYSLEVQVDEARKIIAYAKGITE